MKAITRFYALALAALTLGNTAAAAAPVSQLSAVARDGQVFLTWNEAETPEGTTFNVYLSDRPIGDVARRGAWGTTSSAIRARDWWADPASFDKTKPHAAPVGYLLHGNRRLDPRGGLFVHTVEDGGQGELFFAVTSSDARGVEDARLTAGGNAMLHGVAAKPGAMQPIWQRGGRAAPAGAGKHKPLWLELHAKGGVVANMEYLLFGDAGMGWREGLPLKFSVRVERDAVVVRPTDRVWINRPHLEAGDGGMPAIWTFWYGYNSRIYDRREMASGVPTNFTERRNLWILDWVRNYYQPDAAQWSCSGSSMGGCGTLSFGLHHPELFAALHAHVPIVNYTYLGRGSAPSPGAFVLGGADRGRAEDQRGGLAAGADEQHEVRPRGHGGPADAVPGQRPAGRLDPLGEQPGLLPGVERRPARVCGVLGQRHAPDLRQGCAGRRKGVAAADSPFSARSKLSRVFQHFEQPQPGRWPGQRRRHRGLDEPRHGLEGRRRRAAAIRDHALGQLSGHRVSGADRRDVRRVQRFKIRGGERLLARVGDAPPRPVMADAAGRVTIPGVVISSAAGVRLAVGRAGE